MTREEYAAQCDAEEVAFNRELEWKRIARTLEALYGAVRAGDSSVYTRQRITRLEALAA
ncbi:hypothetical protein ACGFYV_18465 [Streptomyces sp. NPDC048297]|uniref:hypothetical protein n=1 Tax=Streptomyces sp. NPDC048297 TaxID=3365531 RepID=UPI003713B649